MGTRPTRAVCRWGAGQRPPKLAARGISGFTQMLKHYEEHAPLKRNIEPSELGSAGLFLASDMSTATTGQVLYVDGGYTVSGTLTDWTPSD